MHQCCFQNYLLHFSVGIVNYILFFPLGIIGHFHIELTITFGLKFKITSKFLFKVLDKFDSCFQFNSFSQFILTFSKFEFLPVEVQ